MNKSRFILRNLSYFRAANLAVALGMAVATAVLTGALMVGDSMHGSLRALALQRLGSVEHALVSTRFFEQSLAERFPDVNAQPAMIVRGGVASGDGKARVSGVQLAAVGFPAGTVKSTSPLYIERREAVINGEVAAALNVRNAGADVVYNVAAALDTPRDATLARRGVSEVVSGGRVKVARVDAAPGFTSLFNLEGSQRLPRNVWLNLGDLQEAVDQPGRVNAIFVNDGRVEDLNATLRERATLADYGLSVDVNKGNAESVLNSRATFIEPPVLDAARAVATEMKLPVREVSVYLVNDVTCSGSDKAIHYAVGAGINDLDGTKLADGEMAINAWTAEQLGAKVGDTVQLAFYKREPGGGDLKVVRSEPLKLAAVVPMSGLGADSTLTPAYKGLTDADSVSAWDPPQGVDIDKKKVTKADEAYWHEHRAAPKLFVNLDTARKLWGGTFGDVTSLRIPADKADAFAKALRDKIDPAAMGMTFQPIRAKQLEAASGSTDFAMLFVGFSFFLIIAAALLVAMLFRLNIEQRARQLGLLAACGFAPRQLRMLALVEGMTLALLGGVVGLAGAAGYTWLMVAGLRTWWRGAVGTTAIHLYVNPMTLVMGLVASLFVAFLAVLWGVWRVGRTPEARLLAGGWNDPIETRARGRRWSSRAGLIGLGIGLMLVLVGIARPEFAQGAFMGGGAILLTSCLLILSGQLRPRRREGNAAATSIERLGMRNAARHTARSVLSAGLIAFAAFTLVTVAALKQGEPQDTGVPTSGAGGYRLILQSGIPLTGDLGTPRGRQLLGISDPDADIWQDVKFVSMRKWAGQDVSCLNLTKPDSPTILAVPSSQAWAGRFAKSENPWPLLDQPTDDPNVVPVIADHETAAYILKLGVGDTMPLTDQRGVPRKLKLVGTISHSVFQSELLMSETNFLRLFPSQSGFGTVMIDVPADRVAELQKRLSTDLADYAVSVDTTASRLAGYAEVANTYLSTFQVLGSLGLMLGAIGLSVVLLRGLVERRAELALLTAIGFAPAARVKLVLSENAFLLILGLAIGTGCALIGILPTLATASQSINVRGLAATLIGVLLIGLAGLAVAVWIGQRRITTADLRAE